MPSFWLILSPALGIQAGWCLLPASSMLLCGWVGQRRDFLHYTDQGLPVLPEAISTVSVTGEFKWKHAMKQHQTFLEVSGEPLPSEHCRRVGWGGARRRRSQKCFSWPSWCWCWCQKIPADRGTVGSNPQRIVWPTCSSSDIRCKMQAFNFWFMCTSLLIYFYQVFSTPDVAAGDFPRRHLLLPPLLARRARRSLAPGSCRALLLGLPATAS